MHSYLPVRIVHHLLVVGRTLIGSPKSDVIGLNAERLQALLNINADRTAAAPETNDEAWSEPGTIDLHAKSEGIFHDLLLGKKLLVLQGGQL